MTESIILSVALFLALGALATFILLLAAKFMAVEKDEMTEKLRAELPGANCGACGFAGCDDYAAALAAGAVTNLCTPGGDSVSAKVSEILGKDALDVIEMTATVKCDKPFEPDTDIMNYVGIDSCAACNMLYSGKAKCNYACLGYGDCAKVCKYGAIIIENDIARIDRSKCTGCGMCQKACPNNLIEISPTTAEIHVGCSNLTPGALTRSVCSVGCIGCKICEKKCEFDAIKVVDNIAVIDYEKCTNCGKCAESCPTKAIKDFR